MLTYEIELAEKHGDKKFIEEKITSTDPSLCSSMFEICFEKSKAFDSIIFCKFQLHD